MKVLLIGYGSSNKSTLQYLKDDEVYIYDERIINQDNYLSFNQLKDSLMLFDLGIKSPGIKFDDKYLLINSLCKEIISEIDFAYLKLPQVKIIGITGSNGKTSFATFLYTLYSKFKPCHLAGNIGVPLSSIISNIKENDVVILELSSFQIRDSKYIKIDDLFITSLSPNHLDQYLNQDFYYADKKRALLFANNVFFLNESNNILHINKNNDFRINNYYQEISKYIMGKYNIYYINFIINYLISLGINQNKLLDNIKNIKSVKYRLEKPFLKGNYYFINDSKSTSSASSEYAYESYKDKNIILILGGIHKSSPFSIKVKDDDLVLIYGKDSSLINSQIKGKIFINLEEIFIYLTQINKKGYYIIFSPGCSSYDQYENYIKRGEHFTMLVNKYFS